MKLIHITDPHLVPPGQALCQTDPYERLDTLDEGVDGGKYCDARAAWLAARLNEAGDRPAFLFMHHPPFPIHIPCLDPISLAEPERFARIVEGRRNIRHLFCGHVHRPVCGSWRGM